MCVKWHTVLAVTGLCVVVVLGWAGAEDVSSKVIFVAPPSFVQDGIPFGIDGNGICVDNLPVKVEGFFEAADWVPQCRILFHGRNGIVPNLKWGVGLGDHALIEQKTAAFINGREGKIGSLRDDRLVSVVGDNFCGYNSETLSLKRKFVNHVGFLAVNYNPGSLRISESVSVKQRSLGCFLGRSKLRPQQSDSKESASNADDRGPKISSIQSAFFWLCGLACCGAFYWLCYGASDAVSGVGLLARFLVALLALYATIILFDTAMFGWPGWSRLAH
jgi:hypothetical protein